MLVELLSYLDNDGSCLSPPLSRLGYGEVGGKADNHPESLPFFTHSNTVWDALRVSGSSWILIRSFDSSVAHGLLTGVTVALLLALIKSIFC